MRAALSLGANLGDRMASLRHAADAIGRLPALSHPHVSSVYETVPVGGVEQPDFLNLVMVFDVGGDEPAAARDLLQEAQRVEQQLARVREVRWGPRTIDVDVLAVGSLQLTDPQLTVPHPRLAERAFVLVPWAEVDPGFVVPGLGTVAELLGAVPDADRAGVRLLGPLDPDLSSGPSGNPAAVDP